MKTKNLPALGRRLGVFPEPTLCEWLTFAVIIALIAFGLSGLTGCTTAQRTQLKADAKTAATDIILAAPKVVAYTATTAQDILTTTADLVGVAKIVAPDAGTASASATTTTGK